MFKKSTAVILLSIFIHMQCIFAQAELDATSPMSYDAMGFSDQSPFLKIRDGSLERYLHPLSLQLVDKIEESNGGLFTVVVDGAYGVLDVKGKLIADFIYDEIELKTNYNGQWYDGISYNYKFVVTKLDGKYGVIDALGKEITAPQYKEITILDSLTIAFQQGGKWGWLDARTGKVIQLPVYERATVSYVRPGAVEIHRNGKEGLALRDGQVLVAPEYQYLQNFHLPGRQWMLFSKDNHVGLLDSAGMIVLAAQFDDLDPTSDPNVVRFKKGDSIGLWHIKESRVILEGFTQIEGFVVGNSIVRKQNMYGVVNTSGKVLLQPIYDGVRFMDAKGAYLTSYSDIVEISRSVEAPTNSPKNKVKVKSQLYFMFASKDGKQGVFDWEGKEVIPVEYNQIVPIFKDGSAYFEVYQEEQYGLFDGKGKQLLPFEYKDYAYLSTNYYPQSSGYAENYIIPLTKDDRIGLYHVGLNKVILPVVHEYIVWNGFDQINARRGAEDRGYDAENALLDAEGTIIRPYSKSVNYSAVAADRIVETRMIDGEWRNRLVDLSGKTLYENSTWEEFKSNSFTQLLLPKDTTLDASYQDGLLKISGKEEHLFIDRDGNEKRFEGYEFVGDFYEDRAVVMAYANPLDADETNGSAREKERFGIIDSRGNIKLPAIYDRMEKVYDVPELLKVRQDGKWGLVTKKGEIVMDTRYDDIRFSSSLKAYVDIVQDGKNGIAERGGTIVVPPIYERIDKSSSSSIDEAPLFMVFDGEWYHLMDSKKGLLSIKAKNRLGY